VDRYPVTCHGLSLSLGSAEELDWKFIGELKEFLDENKVQIFSEHLSYTKSRNAHLYDLLPIPFRKDAVDHVVDRIKQVQDYLERPLAIENVSYYTPVAAEMSEIEFVNEIVERADCKLLLDVNNVYVNSINHNYNAEDYIKSVPTERIAYIHIAGHYDEADDLKVDTHGADIIDPVWDLLQTTYQRHGVIPTLLERDFNIPSLNSLINEVDQIRDYQSKWEQRNVATV